MSGDEPWLGAVTVDPARRDRETALAAAVSAGLRGGEPPWRSLRDPDLRRRAGYLLDVAQTMRGQTAAEAARLAELRASLGPLDSAPFWPGEPALPPGTDPVAERWGYVRGCNMARLKKGLRAPARMLPETCDGPGTGRAGERGPESPDPTAPAPLPPAAG